MKYDLNVAPKMTSNMAPKCDFAAAASNMASKNSIPMGCLKNTLYRPMRRPKKYTIPRDIPLRFHTISAMVWDHTPISHTIPYLSDHYQNQILILFRRLVRLSVC